MQSILFLVFSIGVPLDIHYCQGTAKSVGVYSSAEKCNMAEAAMDCSGKKPEGISKTPCCSNKQFLFQTEHSQQIENPAHLSPQVVSFFIAPQYGEKNVESHLAHKVVFYYCSDPPVPIADYNILYDTFLI